MKVFRNPLGEIGERNEGFQRPQTSVFSAAKELEEQVLSTSESSTSLSVGIKDTAKEHYEEYKHRGIDDENMALEALTGINFAVSYLTGLLNVKAASGGAFLGGLLGAIGGQRSSAIGARVGAYTAAALTGVVTFLVALPVTLLVNIPRGDTQAITHNVQLSTRGLTALLVNDGLAEVKPYNPNG